MSFAVSQYRTNQVQTQSPARLVVSFYEVLLKHLRLAAEAIDQRNFAQKGHHLSRAHAIVSELSATLDSRAAPELCEELERLYDFVLNAITQSNLRADRELLDPATRVVEELHGAWKTVAESAARPSFTP